MTYDGSLYEKAIEALKARFGRESDIVAANLQAIFDAPSPASSDATGLEKLHAALHCAVSVFEELKYEGDLTSAENLRRVTAKLPMDLRRKWTEHALSLEPQRPSLRDLDDWLGKQVRILINCAAILPPNRSDRSSKGPRRTIVAATQVNEASSQKICTYCGRNNHDVQECRNLGSASPEEKRNFVRSGALCYSCLRKGHRSAQCKRRATCAQCRRRHPTSMHMDTLQYRPNESQQRDQRDLQHHQQHETEVKRAWRPHQWQQHREMQQPGHQYQQQQQQQALQQEQTNSTGVTSCRVSGNTKAGKSALPVVPVVIQTNDVQLHTLAFLDGGSTHSFISQSLFEKLNLANTPRTQLALTTVDRDVRVETQVVPHLTMTDVQGQNQMSLPPLYTVKEIPISREEFPRQADLNEWEHLRDIELPVRDGNEVGLLLGANAHLAMEPLEVLPSREGSPYAVRTRYGWIVVGATRHSEAARVNRIAVREEMSEIEEKIRDMYNHEYEERLHSTRKGLSEDDKRFMKMVEATKGHNEGHYEVGIPLADEKTRLPDNVEVAKRRLSSLEKKMKRNPEFLTLGQDEWPKMPPVMEAANDPEVKGKTVCAAVKTNELTNAEDSPIERLVNHYSEKHAMLRGLAWILRVRRCLLKRAPWRSPRLEAADLLEAESTVIRWQQKQGFPEEYEDLSNGRQVSRRSKIAKLCPIMTEGIVRVGGRLQNANMTSEMKHPIVLPKDGRLTEMIVQEAHEKTGHSGRQMVLASVRKRFWILKGSSCVRKVLGHCTVCRRHRNPESQKMADLPAERVAIEPAFTHTGMDYFGPFYVKQNRSQVKRYGVIFTCLSVRAVHIEVAEDLSADSFLCALRRFKARRVHVKTLHSDRGTNFVGGSKELKEELQKLTDSENLIHRAMLKHGIEFHFNTAAASHHGGAWERQIRSIRRILDRVLNTQQLKEETLTTLLCEIESILNNRPLTPLSCDPADPEPLTPNHLLNLGTDCVAMPFGLADGGDSHSRKRWKQVRYLSEVFWRRWRAEYLPLLQERPQAWTRSRANVRTGDIVLVVDDSVPRGQWPLGLVEDVKVGADGLVRSVDVRIRGLLLQRPVTKLVKL